MLGKCLLPEEIKYVSAKSKCLSNILLHYIELIASMLQER